MPKKEYIAFIFAHFALFVIFVWFGALKMIGVSPAEQLVEQLFNSTLGAMLPFLTFKVFLMLFGGFEVLIGILFIIPKMEKAAMILLIPHMITTILPLIFLPEMTWAGFLVPTLTGQYIIKNIVVVALAASMFADLNKNHKTV